jgi:hypothetical protein
VGDGRGHYKDAILDALARTANVAEFVSFGPDLRQRYAWIRGHDPNHRFASPRAAIATLLERASEQSVNIRSFDPESPKSREFIYGKTDPDAVDGEVRRLADQGLYTIVNETIDVNDGGVSGVMYGDAVEFAPGDTPRCVEKPGTAGMSRSLGMALFDLVYGVRLALPDRHELRVEFSLHPLRRGYRHDHTIIWETEAPGPAPMPPVVAWPNRFSRWIGDKAFGLLVAHLIGLRVPRTQVIGRRVAPFTFGDDTGLAEPWIRTAPTQQVPGKFTTRRGWLDPFRLMQAEDPGADMIASVLAQQGVDARFSGALVAQADRDPLIEGVAGHGDDFMVGRRGPEALPDRVRLDLLEVYGRATEQIGPVRFEWVHDGDRAWVVQLHKGASVSLGRTIFPGEAAHAHEFDVARGIDALRQLIERVKGTGDGIVLVGHVGVTSHFGDLLRHARIPSRLEDPR